MTPDVTTDWRLMHHTPFVTNRLLSRFQSTSCPKPLMTCCHISCIIRSSCGNLRFVTYRWSFLLQAARDDTPQSAANSRRKAKLWSVLKRDNLLYAEILRFKDDRFNGLQGSLVNYQPTPLIDDWFTDLEWNSIAARQLPHSCRNDEGQNHGSFRKVVDWRSRIVAWGEIPSAIVFCTR